VRAKTSTDAEEAGRRAASAAAVTLRYPFNALVSYHYYRKVDLTAMTAGGLRLVGDSGAYSARTLGVEITPDEFAEWVKVWRGQLVWVASLDVINEPEVTWKNYRRLRDKHGLDVVPTLHGGDPARKWIDRYAADGVDFIGLGGLTPHRGRPAAVIPWLADLMKYARDRYPTMRFHGWGCTNPVLTKALPWYSVDSSNLGQSYRYGRLVVFDPSAGRWVQIKMDGRDAYHHDDLLRRCYGVRARDVAVSTPATRQLLVRTTGKSYQLVEDYLRKRHGPVTAPLYGVVEPATGPHVHAALDTKRPAHKVMEELARPGPHMHGTDSNRAHLSDLRRGATGPHVHGTDGVAKHLEHLERT
jgi:hypothetical protein